MQMYFGFCTKLYYVWKNIYLAHIFLCIHYELIHSFNYIVIYYTLAHMPVHCTGK
jgi:hypothetical protein